MHYKTNRLNHDFQIAYFIAGSCHTPDAAYAILCDLRDDRKDALKHVKAASLRTEAKKLKAESNLETAGDSIQLLEAQADLAEIEATRETTEKNIQAAQAELAFIERCIDKIQPLRKHKDVADEVAHELAQAEEWKLRLMFEAQNFMLTQGTIPADHFATMRLHPDFDTDLLPFIMKTQQQIQEVGGDLRKVQLQKKFELPSLLK